MANYVKGTIQFIPVVEQINRKFAPNSKKCSKRVIVRNSGDGQYTKNLQVPYYMGAMTTEKVIAGSGIVRKNSFFFRENAAVVAMTNEIITLRSNFAKACKGAAHILQDLSQITRVQTMWLTASNDATKLVNGVSAIGYTYRGWVMAVQYAGVREDSTYNTDVFPNSFDA